MDFSFQFDKSKYVQVPFIDCALTFYSSRFESLYPLSFSLSVSRYVFVKGDDNDQHIHT